jgi:Protein of unknown function (DUF1091)
MRGNFSILREGQLTKFSGYWETLIDIPSFSTEISIKHWANGKYVKSFLHSKFDACQILKTMKSNQLFRFWNDRFRQYGKLPDRCPAKKDLYYILDYPSRFLTFPEVLPSNKFHFEWEFWTNFDRVKQNIFKIELYVVFEPKTQ